MRNGTTGPITGLLISGDSFPDIGLIRKNLLFFDSISLIDNSDRCLVHKGEVIDNNFPYKDFTAEADGQIIKYSNNGAWNDTAFFPRDRFYDEKYLQLLNDKFDLLNKGYIGIIHTRKNTKINHLINWHLYKKMAFDPAMLIAAAPDIGIDKDLMIDNEKESIEISNIILPNSIYQTEYMHPANIENMNTYWQQVASHRIARFVKGQQLAYSYNSFPLSVDEVNSNIASTYFNLESNIEDNIYQAHKLSLDVVNTQELIDFLNGISWREFTTLRKEILPKVKKLRSFLINEVGKITKIVESESHYIELMHTLKADYEKRKEDYANEWEKLKIVSTLRLGGTAGATYLAQGANLISFPTSITEAVLKLSSLGAIAGAAVSSELKTYLPARRRFKNHPLHFIDKLPH